ncbi:putative amidohydrolase ytcJ [Fusarium bulbicola]|nr:putative amidohydrolase ytcJ [Fusarium bulbicola]
MEAGADSIYHSMLLANLAGEDVTTSTCAWALGKSVIKSSGSVSSLLLAAALLVSPGSAASKKPNNKAVIADTVFHNGSIYSLDLLSTKYSALAAIDGYITFLGDEKSIQSCIAKNTSIFNLEGRMMMPGLVDAHMHPISGGAGLLKCNMNFQPLGLSKVLEKFQSCLDDDKNKTQEDWLEVISLDYYALVDDTGGVTKKDLDKLKTKRPILVASADSHTFWVNSAALKVSSPTSKTKDPRNGKFERLPGSQELSGILQDSATSLLAGPAPPTPEDNIRSIDPLDEWLAIKAGVTRSGDPKNPQSPASQGAPYNGNGLPGLTLTRDQAIRAITTESARFLRADAYIGSLEVGKLADAIVLKANYFEVPEEHIARQKTLLTMVGGEVVYIADGVDFKNGVKARFSNDDDGRMIKRRSVGGIQGRDLSEEGKRPVQRLQTRGACVHSHH